MRIDYSPCPGLPPPSIPSLADQALRAGINAEQLRAEKPSPSIKTQAAATKADAILASLTPGTEYTFSEIRQLNPDISTGSFKFLIWQLAELGRLNKRGPQNRFRYSLPTRKDNP